MATKSEIYRERNNTYSDIIRLEQLKALEDLIAAAGGGGGGLAQESTLVSILNNMIASQDVEILLVRDTGAGDVVVQQIREYDQGTGTWTTRYEDVSGGAYVPVGSLEYLDASAVLNLVLTELQTLNAVDFSTETTLSTVKTDTLKLSTPDVGIATSMLRVTVAGAGSVAAGKRRISFFNAGNNDATVAGATLKAGEVVTFSADGLRDTLAAISYDCLTSELLITTVG